MTAASYTLVFGLFVQTLVLTIYLLARAPEVLKKILGLWKPSLFAGFTGAFASQFWFLAFALTAAANVRTLALVEVLFAQGVAYYSFKQPLSVRELSGIALIVIGVALLVAVYGPHPGSGFGRVSKDGDDPTARRAQETLLADDAGV